MTMNNIGTVEMKLLTTSIVAAGFTGDNLISFLIPIASGLTWFFLKPQLETYRRRAISKKNRKRFKK